jgi:hypothetical protein
VITQSQRPTQRDEKMHLYSMWNQNGNCKMEEVLLSGMQPKVVQNEKGWLGTTVRQCRD